MYPWYSNRELLMVLAFMAVAVAVIVIVVLRARRREARTEAFCRRGIFNVPIDVWDEFAEVLYCLSSYTDSHVVDQPDPPFKHRIVADPPMDAMWVVYEITDEGVADYVEDEIERINQEHPGFEIVDTVGLVAELES